MVVIRITAVPLNISNVQAFDRKAYPVLDNLVLYNNIVYAIIKPPQITYSSSFVINLVIIPIAMVCP